VLGRTDEMLRMGLSTTSEWVLESNSLRQRQVVPVSAKCPEIPGFLANISGSSIVTIRQKGAKSAPFVQRI